MRIPFYLVILDKKLVLKKITRHTIDMNETLFNRSGRLFTSPSLTEGMSRVFDLLGSGDIYNENLTADEADNQALYSDWASVGDHLISASKQLVQDVRR